MLIKEVLPLDASLQTLGYETHDFLLTEILALVLLMLTTRVSP